MVPGIDVEIGIELSQPHGIAASLQQCAKCCRCQTFAKRGDHAAGDEDVPRHGTLDIEGRLGAKAKNQASTSSIGSLFGGRHLRPWRRGQREQPAPVAGVAPPRADAAERAAARPRRNRRVLLGAARREPCRRPTRNCACRARMVKAIEVMKKATARTAVLLVSTLAVPRLENRAPAPPPPMPRAPPSERCSSTVTMSAMAIRR